MDRVHTAGAFYGEPMSQPERIAILEREVAYLRAQVACLAGFLIETTELPILGPPRNERYQAAVEAIWTTVKTLGPP